MANPGMSCNLQNIFIWFLTVSWIAWRSKITFMKIDKSWNVLQASKYFSLIFKTFLDCQKVQNNFYENGQVLEYLSSFKIFFFDFSQSPGLPAGPSQLFWILTSPGMSWKLQNIFLWFLKVSWIAKRSKNDFS